MFDFYKQFVGKTKGPNTLYPLTEQHVVEAEGRLGYQFPSQLRSFFLEVGCGFFTQGVEDNMRDANNINGILSPEEIADQLLDLDNPYRPPEGFVKNTIPFFDIGNFTHLVLRHRSKRPNAVYWPDGKELVSSDLVSFFESLAAHAAFYRHQ